MSTHTIEVTITPLCTACGEELLVGGCQSKVTGDPFNRDWPGGRKDQRVFIYACEKCYVFKGDLPKAPDTETKVCNCPPERTTAHLPECPTLNR